MNSFKLMAIMALGSLVFVSCSDDDDDDMGPQMKTIAQIAAETPRFSILSEALERTELDDVLNGTDEYTVFAPNNDAFADLLDALNVESLDELIVAVGGEDALANILLYHVLAGEVKAADVTTGFVSTAGVYNGMAGAGLSAYISVGSTVRINDASDVIATDIDASNGVIHEISAVILPLNLVDLVTLSPDHTTLLAAVGAADPAVAARLASETEVTTLFAPVNSAFGNLLNDLNLGSLADLVGAIGVDGLTSVLLYHTVDGNIRSSMVSTGAVPTLEGSTFDLNAEALTIMDNNMTTANLNAEALDIQGTNGVIHVIDAVIRP